MFTRTSLQIGDFSEKIMATIAENLLNLDVNYSMEMSPQLTFTVIDPGLEMAANNYFQIGRDVVYESSIISQTRMPTTQTDTFVPVQARMRYTYEITNVTVAQEGSASPQWTIQAHSKAIQQMKRDKKPGNISGSGYEFVRKAANKYGLHFVGEKSGRIKNASKNSGDGQADSVWTVITNIADSSQYVVFVADGTLYFASQKWLMYKWGSEKIIGRPLLGKDKKPVRNKRGIVQKHPDRFFVPLDYPAKSEANARQFEVLKLPSLTKSENDPMAGDGSLVVARQNGIALRPGMTIRIDSVPTMNKFYLITSVSFGEQVTDPVSVEFRTPERLEVNGTAKIPQLPVGKIFTSEYFNESPRLGQTVTGNPTFNETTSPFVGIGSTLNPVGPQSAAVLPNSRRQVKYPTTDFELLYYSVGYTPAPSATSILEAGNIDCWNRPLVITQSDDSTSCVTMRPHIYVKLVDSEYLYIITERIWCEDGVPVTLTTAEAELKYDTSGVHHGIFSDMENAQRYIPVLIRLQKMVVKERFNKSYEAIWNGRAPLVTRCS